MLKGDWGAKLTLGIEGLIVVSLLTIVALNPQQRLSAYASTNPEVRIDRPARNANPNRAEWREERDLEAQQNMGFAALGALAVSFASLVIASVGVRLLNRQIRVSRQLGQDQIAETRRIGEAQVRAYLSVTSLQFAVSPSEQCGLFSIECSNSGNSPAQKVVVSVKVLLGGNALSKELWGGVGLPNVPAGAKERLFPVSLADIPILKSEWGENYEKLIFATVEAFVFADDVFGVKIMAYSSGLAVDRFQIREVRRIEGFIPSTFFEGSNFAKHRENAKKHRWD